MRAKPIVALALGVALIVACADGGKFGTAAGGKKQAKADKQESAGGATSGAPAVEGEPDDTDDQADQPVQITGTYLTCGEVEPPDAHSAIYGCRLARQGTGQTVELRSVAKSWTWNYKLKAGTVGAVETKPQPEGSEWQVQYEISADGEAQIEMIFAAITVLLDLVLHPGASPDQEKTLSAATLLSILVGNKGELSNGIVKPAAPSGPNNPPTNGDDPPPSVATSSTSRPTPTPPAPTIPESQATPEAPVAPSEIVTPTLRFKLQPKGAGFALLAALDDATGVTDLAVTGGGVVAFGGATSEADGGVAIAWSVPMRVSLKKSGKTCSVDGAIGPGALAMTTVCR